MTDKEALDWLISRKEHYEMDDNCQELAEAIQIGINAIEQKPCEDAVSKQAVAEVLLKYAHDPVGKRFAEFLVSQINALPPVTPQKPKTGHWVYDREHCDSLNVAYTCSCCGRRVFVPYPFEIFHGIERDVYKSYPYCHCGAKMLEVKE